MIRSISLCLFALIFLGCPYSVNPLVIPQHLTSVSITTLENLTNQPGLEIEISDAIRNEFIRDNTLAIRDAEIATSVLSGQIKSYTKSANAFDASEQVTAYRLTISLTVSFHDNVTNEDRLKNKTVSQYRIYAVVDEGGNRLDETTQETEARAKLIQQLAEDVLNSIFGDW